ncbi:DUF6517 family protein [Haloarchaeobius sp. DFWS5]|uniref:DUF6517 family protein n=1 Tax=Haloarchaeobius sp. DFWS5 TaxID=3446114 RepID=UPI003EBA9B67
MDLNRRTLLAGTATGIAAGAAGCLGILGGSADFAADLALANEGTASSNNFVRQEPQEDSIEKTFSAGGQSKTVTVRNWVTEYNKTLDLPILSDMKAGVFAVVSTPKVEILGQSFNPIKDWDPKKTARMLQDQYEGFSIGEEVGSGTVQVLGSSTAMSKFEGTATMAGQNVDVYVLIAKAVPNEGDFVLSLGVYPQQADEEGTITALMESIEHPAEA